MKRIMIINGLMGIVGLGGIFTAASCSCSNSDSKPKPKLDEFRIVSCRDQELYGAIIPFTTFAGEDEKFKYNNRTYDKTDIFDVEFFKLQKKLPAYLFYNCHSLKLANLIGISEVGAHAFENCNNLNDLDLHGVSEIGDRAFCGTNSLKCISIDDTNPTYVLMDSGNQDSPPQPVSHTDDGFLRRLNDSPDKITATTGNEGGVACGYVRFPSDATVIETSAFYNCGGIRSLDLNGITDVRELAFNSCSNIETLKASSVENIGADAFSDCVSIKSINIESATEIKNKAFFHCDSLQSIDLGVRDSEPIWSGTQIFDFVNEQGNVDATDYWGIDIANAKSYLVDKGLPEGWTINYR